MVSFDMWRKTESFSTFAPTGGLPCWRSIFFSAAATWELSPALRNVDSSPSAIFSSCIRNRSYRHRQPLFYFFLFLFSTDSVAFLPSNRQTVKHGSQADGDGLGKQLIDVIGFFPRGVATQSYLTQKKVLLPTSYVYNLSFPSICDYYFHSFIQYVTVCSKGKQLLLRHSQDQEVHCNSK